MSNDILTKLKAKNANMKEAFDAGKRARLAAADLGKNGIRGKYLALAKSRENVIIFLVCLALLGFILLAILSSIEPRLMGFSFFFLLVIALPAMLYCVSSSVENDKKSKELGISSKFVCITYLLNQFICPTCLKVIETRKIRHNCPYCETVYSGNEKALFEKCVNCQGILKYLTCYYCGNTIDLFAPYDENKLEIKRYE